MLTLTDFLLEISIFLIGDKNVQSSTIGKQQKTVISNLTDFYQVSTSCKRVDMDSPSWSDPPLFLMIEIVKHINSRFHILRIRSVCRLWRSFVPSPFLYNTPPFLTKVPWPVPLQNFVNPKQHGYYRLTEIIICRLEKVADTGNSHGSSKEWMVIIEEGMLSIISSPKQSLSAMSPKVLNFMDFRVMEIHKAYKLLYVDSSPVPVFYNPFDFFKAVVFSLGPNCTSLDDFAIIVVLCMRNLCFLKVGDKKWMENTAPAQYGDIVSYKGKIYAVTCKGKLVMLDFSRGLIKVTRRVFNADHRHLYLVESFGDLLLVIKNLKHDIDYDFQVYKLDEQEQCWVQISSLEDKALFVSKQCSFSVKAKDINGNCIYYRDMDDKHDEQAFLYDLTDGSIELVKSLPCPTDISWPPSDWR